MNKVSLLAASVAIALAGCGGSDGGSNNNAGGSKGLVVTGFDGYFYNAVVFDDVNNDGVLDVNVDTVFGLTDRGGKITLPENTKIEGAIALKTLKPGDTDKALATKLAALTPAADTYSDFMNTYTTDMDHEGQPMANAVVFRAPVSAEDKTAVISPLTDLVAIEMANGKTEDAAISAVTTALGGTEEQPIDLFSDFVKNADSNLESAKLHKTAQILTESKAKNPTEYEKNSANIAGTAKDHADKIVKEDNMGSEELLNNKPVIDPVKPELVVENYKLLVNEAAKAEISKHIAALEIKENTSFSEEISIPNNLFEDKYNGTTVRVKPTVTIDGKGINATLSEDGTVLTLTATELQPTLNQYTITFTAQDRETESSEALSSLRTTFSFSVELSNTAPVVDVAVQELIQTDISTDWKLKQGVIFSESILIDGLFDDREGDKLTYITDIETVIPGLKSSYDASTGMITISGNPQKAETNQKQFTIIANDGHSATRIASKPATFTLPTVAQGEITIVDSVKAELQQEISKQWSLKVNESFKATLNISGLFSDNINGDIEYYAHYAANDNTPATNPISGVEVSVDKSGLVTLSGTPTKETKGVILYLAKGINTTGGKENDIESEMVLLNLPNVQPADEVTPPPSETTSLEGKTWFFTEYGLVDGSDSEKGNDQIWCDSIKFEHGKVFTNTRTDANLTTCSKATTEWVGATYEVSENGTVIDASLPFEESDGTVISQMRYKLESVEKDIADSAVTVYMQETYDDELESQRYTFFSDKVDLEKRLNVQSDAGWDGRVFSMYLPTNSGLKLGTVSLSMEENSPPYSDGAFDAGITFDVPDEDFTCEMAKEVFRSFTLTNGENVYASLGFGTSNFECHTSEEDGVYYSTIDFDLPSLVKNDVYSFLGKTTDSGRTQVEQIKFNMEWTGVGNDE